MHDFMLAMAFVAMVIAPCVVAMVRLPDSEPDRWEMEEQSVLSRTKRRGP